MTEVSQHRRRPPALPKLEDAPIMPTEDNKRIVRDFIHETLNCGYLEKTGEYVADDVVELAGITGQASGLGGMKQMISAMRSAFPDLRWTVEEQIAEGESVATRFTWTGTHQGKYLGVAATGRQVSAWGLVIDRLQNGKIKETRILMDYYGLMQQLGVIG